MVSHPETGSDSPIGSDRDRGRDTNTILCTYLFNLIIFQKGLNLGSDTT